MAATKKPEACPECGKKLLHVSTHMKTVHGIAGGKSGRVRRNGTKPTFQGFTQVKDMILLQDDQGNMWLAERIR